VKKNFRRIENALSQHGKVPTEQQNFNLAKPMGLKKNEIANK